MKQKLLPCQGTSKVAFVTHKRSRISIYLYLRSLYISCSSSKAFSVDMWTTTCKQPVKKTKDNRLDGDSPSKIGGADRRCRASPDTSRRQPRKNGASVGRESQEPGTDFNGKENLMNTPIFSPKREKGTFDIWQVSRGESRQQNK